MTKLSSSRTAAPPGRRIRSGIGLLACAAVLASAATPSAQAATIGFDNVSNIVTPALPADSPLYNGGDRFTTDGFLAVVADSAFAQSFPDYEPGLAGAVVGAQQWSACTFLACPFGETSYYAGVNDGSLTLSREDGSAFRLSALTYAGIGPESEEGAAHSMGQLRLWGSTAAGSVITATADLPDLHAWADWTLDNAFAGTSLTSLRIDACAYTAAGACLNDGTLLNASQFAVGTLSVSAVPEPSALAMLAGGLALLGAASRTRRLRNGGRA
ncbi:NF038120 family PEP-CTERM protein [Pseudoduganella sp. SL102]|uniref:NF038120 family PEP-CTERM protein n=1 Tax=Pseudoduganella sp. SL102 TaxID=2995154 RepID=UPI00248C3010|nr:NF038120 family PEP-CTERM protein [Pseudoduganella sp. SL102]WBS00794.1 NF038120 family PEP-CTERM protein [Pseudoduganella sp. SL102]